MLIHCVSHTPSLVSVDVVVVVPVVFVFMIPWPSFDIGLFKFTTVGVRYWPLGLLGDTSHLTDSLI